MIFVGSTMLDSTIRQHVALYGDPLIAGFAGFTLLWGVFVGNRLAWPFVVKTISTLFIIQAVIYDNFFVHLLLVLATVADIAFTLSASPQRPKDHLQADPLSMGAIGGSVSFILILACLDLAGHLSAIYLLFWLIVISLVSAVLWTRSFVGQVAMLDKRTEPLGLAMHAGFYIVAIGILFMRAI
jgi:hypothetical protein